jgi:FtsH-binding integral membrane protein
MSIEYVDRFQPRIADIRYGGADPERFAEIARRIADAKSDVRSGIHQLTDDTLHRVAIYVAGGLVADGVALVVKNVGSERHTWWGWLLIGVPLAWLSFLGLVALTFATLRVIVGALRSPLLWTARMLAQARVAVPTCFAAPARVFVDLVGPGAVEQHRVRP